MMRIIQIGDRSSQWLNPSRRAIFSACHRDIDRMGALERAFDLVIDLGSSLAQVGPLVRVLKEAVLVGAFRTPNYTG